MPRSVPRAPAGSSPRGRGTPASDRAIQAQRRFIPARAGNAAGASATPRQNPVHPRAGGERLTPAQRQQLASGSSPRGRGTRIRPAICIRPQRFIPARAGNASGTTTNKSTSPVHPRAGGERAVGKRLATHSSGSSPRGRGTRQARGEGASRVRFIPARAGNATCARAWSSCSPVHPRAGGERLTICWSKGLVSGSSPRGRGTPALRLWESQDRRFIPARAGNASASPLGAGLRTVHPRAGGERHPLRALGRATAGSSPRGRGTLACPSLAGALSRFIPARAGNANSPGTGSTHSKVHPRAGGERGPEASWRALVPGSSPRGRGTHRISV